MPRSRASMGELIVTSSPSRRIRPSSGWWTPLRHLMSVDLPAPLSPRRARISPCRSSRLISSRASVAPNRFVRFRTSRIGVSLSSCLVCSRSASTSLSLGLEGAEPPLEIPAEHVELYGEDDDPAGDHQLPELVDVQQVEAVRDHPEDERAYQGPADIAPTAKEAGSSYDDGGDGLQLPQLAGGRVTRGGPAGGDQACETGHEAAYYEHRQDNPVHGNTRAAGRLLVTPDEVDPTSPLEATGQDDREEREPGDQEHRYGDGPHIPVSQRDDDRRYLGYGASVREHERQAPRRVERREGRDESVRQLPLGEHEPVEETRNHTSEEEG